MAASFTCITCRVAFLDPELQRAHYKTEWHRYNLKRKVAQLPPVTEQNFKQRLDDQQAQSAEQLPTSGYCKLCQKKFSTKNACDNHLNSKKHKDLEAIREQKVTEEIQRLNEKNREKGIEITEQGLKDINNLAIRNVEAHESKASSSSSSQACVDSSTQGARGWRKELFGDDQSDAAADDADNGADDDDNGADDNSDSDESWDGDILGLEECLFCSHISESFEGNVDHLTGQHSFFIPDLEYIIDLEGFIAYLGEKVGAGRMCLWCNQKSKLFRTTKSVQQHMVDKGHCKLMFDGQAALEYTDFYDYRSSYPDYKGDDDDGDDDEVVQPNVLPGNDYQLTLPSGSTIGHRSLMRYYKQKFPTADRKTQTRSVSRILATYKALGWTGNTGQGAVRRAKDLGYVQRMKARHQLKLCVKNNKMQPHFRQQVLF